MRDPGPPRRHGVIRVDTSILYRFLVVEADADDGERTVQALRSANIRFEFRITADRRQFIHEVHEFEPDLVLSDYRLPHFSGLDAIHILRAAQPDTPLILVTGALGDEMAAGLILEGAADYVLKRNLARLPNTVMRVLRERDQRRRVKNAEREAAAQQSRLTQLFLRSMDGILVLGRRGEILDANPAAGTILGYPEADLIGMPWTRFVEQTEDEMAPLIGASDEETQLRRLFSVRHHDNRLLDIDTTIAVQHDADGSAFVYVIFRDVTQQLAAERRLVKEKDLQQLLREVSYHPASLDTHGPEFRILLDRIRRFLGWDVAHVFERNGHHQQMVPTNVWAGETVDQSFISATRDAQFRPGTGLIGQAAESRECVWVDVIADASSFQRRAAALQSGLHSALAFPVTASGRAAAVFELYSREPRTFDPFIGHATRVLGHELGRLFERKWFEENMNARRMQLESLIENAPDLIIRIDRERRVLLVNSKIEILGLTVDRAIGKTLAELAGEIGIEDQTVALWYATIDRVFNHGEAGILEWSATISGRTIHIQASVVPECLPGGAVETALSFNRDFSEQVAVKESLRERDAQIQRIQRLETVGRLAGGVAHDFNNILTAINGYLYLVGMEVEPESKIAAHIEGIRFATDRAARLTEQLLLFSKRAPIELHDFDLNSVVAEVSQLLSRLIPENIRLQTEFSPQKAVIRGDAGKIEQVIMNLVINARDAMPDGGVVTIQTRRIPRRLPAQAQSETEGPAPNLPTDGLDGEHHEDVVLSVIDSGVGMDDSVKARLFDPFFSTKGHERGTGLGLPVVYGIVEEHRGSIRVDSVPGRGSTFELSFPAASKEERAKVMSVRQVHRRSDVGGRVLVVEDDRAVREIVQQVLSSAGMRVTAAGSITDATRFLAEDHGFDIILSDVVLPDGSGTRILDLLGRNTPVVFASGYLETLDDLEEVISRGAAFVQKPYDLDRLVTTLQHALTGETDG